jgi:GT2 family glycosyltransferase
MTSAPSCGIVVIGRNEGQRLERSLLSVAVSGMPAVYVDSGSTDGSPEVAERQGFAVVRLDPGRPFSAARARNEGFDWLLSRHPNLERVQFVDGDCEVVEGWLETGVAALRDQEDVAIVAGHVRERYPEANVYHRLGALEWIRTPGDVPATGGNLMVRVAAFREVGGFDPAVVAGEEEEFCLRLRETQGRVVHVDANMVWHDIGMARFSQWWARTRRTGQAYAQGVQMHGRSRSRHYVRQTRSVLAWGLGLPVAALVIAAYTQGSGLLLLGAYAVLAARVYRTARRRGWRPVDARAYALFTTLGKFPAALGVLEFHWRRLRGEAPRLIEHKNSGTGR